VGLWTAVSSEDSIRDRGERAGVAVARARGRCGLPLPDDVPRGVPDERVLVELGAPARLADRQRERDGALRTADRVAPVLAAAGDLDRARALSLLHEEKADAARGAGPALVAVSLAAGIPERVPLRGLQLDEPAVAVGRCRAVDAERGAGERRILHRRARREAGLERDPTARRVRPVDQR